MQHGTPTSALSAQDKKRLTVHSTDLRLRPIGNVFKHLRSLSWKDFFRQETALAMAELAGLLPLVHKLEGGPGGERIAPLAETLLDEIAAAGDPSAAAAVGTLRDATRRRKAERAARNRAKMLASCGISQVSAQALKPPTVKLCCL